MDQSSEETEKKKASLRKRLGKAIFWIGIIVIVCSLIPTIASAVGVTSMGDAVLTEPLGYGMILVIFGLIAALFPDGQGQDGTWIMKMSPYAGTN